MSIRATPDNQIDIRALVGSIADAHLVGRERDGKPVDMFGCRWTVKRTWVHDDVRTVVLTRAGNDWTQMMCWSCGSFEIDKVEVDDPYYCTHCGSRDIEGVTQPAWDPAVEEY